jgi:glycerol-3-phosphate acyltransferase PlsY
MNLGNFQLSTFDVQSLNSAVPVLAYIITAISAYLLGSIPTGYLVARAKGIDIRTIGSGNIGATNAMRVLGKPAGIFVLLVDAAKGFAACHFGAFIYSRLCEWHAPSDSIVLFSPEEIERFAIIAGIFVVLGHNFTCWLGFKGGKGVATSAGVFFALAPLALGIALGIWIIVLALSRYVSLASLTAAVALPATVWLTPNSLTLRIVTTALGLLAIVKHKSNIERLFNGTELRFGEKNATPEATK